MPSVFAPWSESVRYTTARKPGYHGGATPQEALPPLAVFSAGVPPPNDWKEATDDRPVWWSDFERSDETPAVAEIRAVEAMPRVEARTQAGQLTLFDRPPAPGEDWIERLLRSPLLTQQRKLNPRTPMSDDRVRRLLEALDARGGKLPRPAVARVLDVPAMRVDGAIASLRRLLNLDGYPVLAEDRESDTLELNRKLLELQFQLD